MTYDKPEQFKDNTTNIFHNMNIILDELTKRIEAIQGVARFLHTRLNSIEDRLDVLELMTARESRKESSDKLYKRVSSTTFLNEEDSLEKNKKKYKKKYPNKNYGRPRKQTFKEVYNPDKDEMRTGIE